MWKKLDSKIIFQHPRLTLIEDHVELPNGHRTTYLKFAGSLGGVTVICEKDGRILLQKEYSYPPNEVLFQFPGGAIEDGEDAFVAASRELLEEAGLRAATMKPIGRFLANNRRSDVYMNVFIARDCDDVGKSGGDIEEDITSHWMLPEEIEACIADGTIINGPLLAAWSLYRSYRLKTHA